MPMCDWSSDVCSSDLGIKKDGCSAEIQDKGYIEPTDLNIDKYRKKCKIGDALTLLEENVSEDYKITDEQNLGLQIFEITLPAHLEKLLFS